MTDGWLLLALCFAVATAAAGALGLRASLPQRIAAAQLASATAVLALLALAAGTEASGLYDAALVAVLASFAGQMIAARFMERWP